METIKLGGLYGNHQAGSVWDKKALSPTIDTMQGGNRQPMIVESVKQLKICTESKNRLLVKQATKDGYIECNVGGVADLSYPDSTTRRGRVIDGGDVCPTLMANGGDVCRLESAYRIRKLTPKECWRLMGFDDESFEKAERVNSNTQLYKQAGNSIVVDVLVAIFGNLLVNNRSNWLDNLLEE